MALVVLVLAVIPVGALIGFAREPSGHRRSRFHTRFAALLICMLAPWLVDLVAPLGLQAGVSLAFAGLAWGLLLVALAPFVLFGRAGHDPGPSDDSDGGLGPDDSPQPPPPPIGGIPLPRADGAGRRVRKPSIPRREPHPRGPARPPARRTVGLSALGA